MTCKKCGKKLIMQPAHQKGEWVLYCECHSYVRPVFKSKRAAQIAKYSYNKNGKKKQTMYNWWEECE